MPSTSVKEAIAVASFVGVGVVFTTLRPGTTVTGVAVTTGPTVVGWA